MPTMLAGQLDYIFFFYGLSAFLLGAICLSMPRTERPPTPWWLMAAWALPYGVTEWLHLLALTGGDSNLFSLTRVALTAACYAFLFEFARRTHRMLLGTNMSPWLYLVPGGALLGLTIFFGPAHLESEVRLLIAAPAIFWTAGLFLVAATRTESLGGGAHGRNARRLAGFFFGVFGLVAGVITPAAPFLPGPWPNPEAFLQLTEIPIQLVRGALLCATAASVWSLSVSFDHRSSILRKKRRLFWAVGLIVFGLLAAGWLFTDKLGKLHDQDAIDEAEASTAQVYDHLAEAMQEADGGARVLASLLGRFHVPGTAIDPSRLDQVVDSMALASNVRIAFVMDPEGRTISTSNRGQPDSFLGKNFAEFPYFSEAFLGNHSRFLGEGTTSEPPGFFASEPVRRADGRVVAVAVVKHNLTKEQLGSSKVDATFIVTAEGQTILSNGKNQGNHPLWGSGRAGTSRLADSGGDQEPAPAHLDDAVLGTEWVSIDGRREVAVRRSIPGSDWSLVMLKQEKTQVANRLLGIIITLLLCSVVLTHFVAMQRQFGTESLISTKRREAEGRAREFARKADTDALTGVLNRLGFNGAFSREFERARRYKQPLSVVILDLDHFKRVNDEHGHVAGDQVLVGVARIIESSVRESDVIARWGGEEFVVLAPMTQGHGAARLAEKLRAQMAASSFAPSGAVTGSFGVAELKPGEGIESLLHRADAALYRAKSGGRNRVECADADTSAAVAREAAAGRDQGARPGSSSYTDTGCLALDREHRAMGAALEDFVRTVNAGQVEEVQAALEMVIAGAGAHFKEEERLMEEFAYPQQLRHQETHAFFMDDAAHFLEELKQGGLTANFRRWAVGRVVEWFRFHILAYDVVLGHFLRTAGAVEEPGH